MPAERGRRFGHEGLGAVGRADVAGHGVDRAAVERRELGDGLAEALRVSSVDGHVDAVGDQGPRRTEAETGRGRRHRRPAAADARSMGAEGSDSRSPSGRW